MKRYSIRVLDATQREIDRIADEIAGLSSSRITAERWLRRVYDEFATLRTMPER